MSTGLRSAPVVRAPWRLWGGLLAAAGAWLVAYQLNRSLWEWAVFDLAGFDSLSRWGSAVEFFFYDTVKILLLLGGIIFAVTVLRSFMSVERTRALLGGRREGVGNIAAAGLGVVTPFCSCSAVPGFIGFVAAGVPLGITMSFLIASPMVNEVAIVLLYGLFGWKIAALYVTAGTGGRDRGRVGDRSSPPRKVGGALRLRDNPSRPTRRHVYCFELGRPFRYRP